SGRGSLIAFTWSARGRRSLVKRFSHLMRDGLQGVEGIIHSLHSAFFRRFLRIGDSRFDLRRDVANLFAVLIQRLLHLINETVEAVTRFDLFAFLCVFRRM